MPDLVQFQAKRCFTATAFLIHQERILLVKHKKLNIWLAPGGHVEIDELPHVTAERECFEETGLTVRAVSAAPLLTGTTSQYLPSPFVTNLHWISKENYHARLESSDVHKRVHTDLWPNGCEQHLVFCYLVQPTGSLKLTQDHSETTGIGWFTLAQIASLDTSADIKAELRLSLSLSSTPGVAESSHPGT